MRKGRRSQEDNARRPCNLRPGTARSPEKETQETRGQKRIKTVDKREAERERKANEKEKESGGEKPSQRRSARRMERKKEEKKQRIVKEKMFLRLIGAVNACHVEGRVGAVATD